MKFSTLFLVSSSLITSTLAHPRARSNPRHERYLARQLASSQLPTDVTVPPLADITSSAVSETTEALSETWGGGATPTIPGAPDLPWPTIMTVGYPQQDQTPPTDSAQVQQWLTELDGYDIPDIPPTVDGSCLNDPGAAANATASGRCWWTCGQCSRPEDITVCPDKYTWGVSYDDGPSPYTSKILNYLDEVDVKATFFVVGSRVPGRADILQSEYMAGHMISVHTWSHPPLTSLTNEQIVAELGWTRQIIKDAIGVTPNTMRPPYGDIDDRVRAISLAMGLRPIIWTSYEDTNFDTSDWKIPGGTSTGNSSLAAFETILEDAQDLNTGFIVLEHDLYQQTVDLAIGYILPMALTHVPAFNLTSINNCWGLAASEAYQETASSSPFRATDEGVNTVANNTSPYVAPPNSSPSATSGAGAGGSVPSGTLGLAQATSSSVAAGGSKSSGAMGRPVIPKGMWESVALLVVAFAGATMLL